MRRRAIAAAGVAMLLLIGLVAGSGLSAAAQHEQRRVLLFNQIFGSKPKTIALGAHAAFVDLTWKRWGKKRAVAHGRLTHWSEDPPGLPIPRVKITAFDLRSCGPVKAYLSWRATASPGSETPELPDSAHASECPTIPCGKVLGYYPDTEGGSGLEVSAVKVPCRRARSVAMQCIRRYRVPGWGKARFTDNTGELVMRRGERKIYMQGIAGGGPHCGIYDF